MDPVVKAGEQSASDPFKFIMSTQSKDRMGDIIVQDGWDLSDFKRNPVALFGHDHKSVIGTWADVRVEGRRLVGQLKMAAAGTSQLVDEVRSLLEQRILKAVSVGFTPIEAESLDPKNDPGGWNGVKFIKQALHECSVVAVPANAQALIASKSLSREMRSELIRAVEGASPTPRGSGLVLEGDSSDIVRARRAYQRQFPKSEY